MVSLRKIEAVITAMNAGNASGLRSRLQYLNLQRFPPGFKIGSRKRADYDLDEVLAFSLWFSLTQASLTPATAMALVVDFWPEFARLYLSAAAQAGVSLPAPPSHDTIGVITGNALSTSGRATPAHARALARPFDIRTSDRSSLGEALGRGFDARIVLDLAAVHTAVGSAIALSPLAMTTDEFNAAILAFATREGWSPNPSHADEQPEVRVSPFVAEPRGKRLCEMDFYYARALEMLDAAEDFANATQSGSSDRCQATISPRLVRTIRYLLHPAPRESWKRWLAVAEGVNFYYATAATASSVFGLDTGIPDTLTTAVLARFAGCGEGARSLTGCLRAAAEDARDMRLVQD